MSTITSEELKIHFLPKKSKYNNVISIVDGIRFDSKKEARQYGKYKLLEKAGELTFKRQVRYDLIIDKVNCGFYKADFVVTWKSGNIQVVDVKGKRTSVYMLKKKLMLAIHGINIYEI